MTLEEPLSNHDVDAREKGAAYSVNTPRRPTAGGWNDELARREVLLSSMTRTARFWVHLFCILFANVAPILRNSLAFAKRPSRETATPPRQWTMDSPKKRRITKPPAGQTKQG